MVHGYVTLFFNAECGSMRSPFPSKCMKTQDSEVVVKQCRLCAVSCSIFRTWSSLSFIQPNHTHRPRTVRSNCVHKLFREKWLMQTWRTFLLLWVVIQLSRKIRSLLAHASVKNSDPVVAIKSIELFYTLLVPLVPCKLFILSSYFRQP